MYEMNSKMFTIEQDEKLIEVVRNHPILYDTDHKDYRRVELKLKVWETISEAFGVSPEVCHVRWRTIRDTHRRNVNRTRSKGKLSFKSKYTKKIIEFLDSTFKDNPMTYVDDPEPACVVQLEEIDCSESLDSSNQGEKDNQFESFVDDYIEFEASSSPEAAPPKIKRRKLRYPTLAKTVSLENEKSAWDEAKDKDPLETVKTGGKKAKDSRDNVKSIWLSGGKIVEVGDAAKSESDDRDKSISEIIVERSSLAEKTTAHPVDNFFASMADVVKTFPPHLIAEARMKVCQIVSELEISALQKNDPALASSLPNSVTSLVPRSNRPSDPLAFDGPQYLQL